MTAAGWFADPTGRREVRYWDGSQWTEYVSTKGDQGTDEITGDYVAPQAVAAPPPPPSPGQVATFSRGAALIVVGAAALIVGALLPWVTASAGFINASKAGTEGDGVITLGVGVLVLVLGIVAWKPQPHGAAVTLSIIAGIGAGIIAAIDIADVSDKASSLSSSSTIPVQASVGIGLWVTAAGAVIVFVGALVKGNEG